MKNLSTLFADLDNAVEAVKDRRQALDATAASVQQTITVAQAKLAAATKDYDGAVATAQAIRAELRDSLDTVLPADDGRVRVS